MTRNQCEPGKRVHTRDGHLGVIASRDRVGWIRVIVLDDPEDDFDLHEYPLDDLRPYAAS